MTEPLPDTRVTSCRHPTCHNRLEEDGCNLKIVQIGENGHCMNVTGAGPTAPGTEISCTEFEPLVRPDTGPIPGTCVHEEECKSANKGYKPPQCRLRRT